MLCPAVTNEKVLGRKKQHKGPASSNIGQGRQLLHLDFAVVRVRLRTRNHKMWLWIVTYFYKSIQKEGAETKEGG